MDYNIKNIEKEKSRVENLLSYHILFSKNEKEYDHITTLASLICGTKISMINFLDEENQWSKSCKGANNEILKRENSFCSFTIENTDIPYVITDTSKDLRFKNNPYVVSEPYIKFYAGFPITTDEGFSIGTVCVLDTETIELSAEQIDSLKLLADQVKSLLNLRKSNIKLKETSFKLKSKSKQLDKFFEANTDFFSILRLDLSVVSLNHMWEKTLGHSIEKIIKNGLLHYVHPDDMQDTITVAKTITEEHPILTFSNRYLCADGSYKTLEWRSFKENDLIYSSTRDISEKIAFQSKIHAQKLYTESILAAMPDLLFILSKDGYFLNFKSMNENDLILKPDQFIMKNVNETFSDSLSTKFLTVIERALSSKSTQSIKYTLKLNDKFQDFEARIAPFENDKVVSLVRNITEQKRVEDQLYLTKDLLEKAGEISKTGAWEVNMINENLNWSKTTKQIMEVDEDYIPTIENAILFYKEGESRRKITEAVNLAVENNIPYDLELEIITANGNEKWVRTQGQPIFIDEKCVYFYGTFQDITEKNLQEKAIKESEDDYRKLFENMAQGVVYQKADGTIIRANNSAEKILGLTYDQMIGRTSIDPRWSAIHKDGSPYPGDEHPAMIALKNGEVIKNQVMGVFHPLANKYCWISIDAIPEFRENETKPYRVLSTFKDITFELQTQNEIIESKATLQAIIESSQESIWSLDTDLKVIYCNKKVSDQFELAYGRKLTAGMPMLELIPDSIKTNWETRYKKALNGESVIFTEAIEIDQKAFLFESSVQPVFVNQKIIGIAVFSKDVTEASLHISTIEKQNEILKEIAWTQSHKVRSPLARIMGLVMLLEEEQSDIPTMDIRKEILNSSTELDSIIKEISAKTYQLENLEEESF